MLAAPALAQTPPEAPAAPSGFKPPELKAFVAAEVAPGDVPAEGAVVKLELAVDTDGKVISVKVVESVSPALDAAATAAAQRFEFTPGTNNGKPVPVTITYAYRFDPPPPPEPAKPAPTTTLDGTVLERGTRVPVAGAQVAAMDPARPDGEPLATGETDEKGVFRLEGLPPGDVLIVIVATRHKKLTSTERVALGESLTVRYRIEANDYDPYQTTVEGERVREEVERKVIPIEEASRVPGTRGDALRAVESFPGVARPPLGVGLLVVRGSSPEDTLGYVDGHWFPIIYHFGGITSIIPNELIDHIDYLPGNFSARYGHAMGAVVDVGLRAPRTERWHSRVDVNVIDASFMLRGPLWGGSFAIGGRRSWIDAVIKAAVPADAGISFTTAPVYYDWQALWSRRLGPGKFHVALFGVDDRLKLAFAQPQDIDPALRGSVENHTYGHRLQVTWDAALSPRTNLLLTYGVGFGGFQVGFGPSLGIDLFAQYNSYRAEVTHRPFKNVKISIGTDALLLPVHIKVQGPRPPAEGEVGAPPSAEQQFKLDRQALTWTPALYAEAEIGLGGGLTITPGSRLEYYWTEEEYVVDPRITARWQHGIHTVRAGLGRYSQYPQPWESDGTFGNSRLDPEHATHVSLGYDVAFAPSWKLESTLYYKDLTNQIVRDDTPQLRPDNRIGPIAYTNDGKGRIYGAELLVRREMGKRFFGWLSYSLSKSERKDHPGDEWRPFQLDQTHIVTLVASARLPWRLEAGARFRYVTGNPDTPILGSVYDADRDVYVPIPGEFGTERLGAFWQVDIRVERRWVFESWMLTGYLDIQNATNHLSPEGPYYSADYRDKTTITGLPFIPSLGVKGEF